MFEFTLQGSAGKFPSSGPSRISHLRCWRWKVITHRVWNMRLKARTFEKGRLRRCNLAVFLLRLECRGRRLTFMVFLPINIPHCIMTHGRSKRLGTRGKGALRIGLFFAAFFFSTDRFPLHAWRTNHGMSQPGCSRWSLFNRHNVWAGAERRWKVPFLGLWRLTLKLWHLNRRHVNNLAASIQWFVRPSMVKRKSVCWKKRKLRRDSPILWARLSAAVRGLFDRASMRPWWQWRECWWAKDMNGEARGRDIHDGKERTCQIAADATAFFKCSCLKTTSIQHDWVYDASRNTSRTSADGEIREGRKEGNLPADLEREFKHQDVTK